MELLKNNLGQINLLNNSCNYDDKLFKKIKSDKPIVYMKMLKVYTDDKEDHLKIYKTIKIVYKKFVDKKMKFASIYDASELVVTFNPRTIAYAKSFSSFLKSQKPIISNNCYATAVMLNNERAARFLNMFLKIYENERPIKIVTTIEEAMEFLNIHIKEDNFESIGIQDLNIKEDFNDYVE
jgi:hypothetical protein